MPGAGALVVKASLPPPMRAALPGAVLLTEGVGLAWPDRTTGTRQFVAPASHRAVVEWYRGKDSLLPLPAVMWSNAARIISIGVKL